MSGDNSNVKIVNKKTSLKERRADIKQKRKQTKKDSKGFMSFATKIPSSFTILFFVLLIVMILTWAIPGEFYFNDLFTGYSDPINSMAGISGSTTIDQAVKIISSSPGTNIEGYVDYTMASTLQSMIGIDVEGWGTITGSTTISEINTIWNMDPNPIVITHNPQGLLNVFYSIAYGFADALPIILYVLVLGGFLEIVMDTGAMEKGASALLKKSKGKEIFIIPLLFTLFSLGGTTFGMQEETIGFFIIVVPILIMAGFDAVTGMIVIVLGSTTGMVASTVNPFSIGVATDAIDGIGIGNGIGFRWVYWVVFTTMGAIYVTRYARRVQKTPELSVISEKDRDKNSVWANSVVIDSSEKLTSKDKSTLAIFVITFLAMIFFIMPWYEWVPAMSKVPQVGWHWYSWLAGATPGTGDFPYTGIGGPGSWYFMEIIVLFIVSSVIISAINWKGEKHFFDTFISGAQSMLSVGFIIAVSRGVPMLMSWSGIDSFIIDSLSSAASGLNELGFVIIAYFIFILLSLVIPSTSGLAGATMPLMGSTAISVGGTQTAVATVNSYTIASGAINMITPAQGVLMAQTEASQVKYTDYLKVTMPYFATVIVMGIPVVLLSTIATF
ncbi:MAG: YfcC family protein [Mycoplasmataceae bacterium]|nr:YfcC family protein [Mycoplasmataceae bacterium]